MKKFVTAPKVDAEVHGGSFLWESFRLILTINGLGKVTYKKEFIGPNPSAPQILTGHVMPRDGNSWLEMHIFRESRTEKLIFYALENADSLVCSIYSEFNKTSSSEIFYTEQG